MKPTHGILVLSLALGVTGTTHAELLLNETFSAYTGENLVPNAAIGTGLTGTWSGSGFFKNEPSGLTMTGVGSYGGNLALTLYTGTGKTATAAFATPLPAEGTLFGSYLFSTTLAATNARTVGGVGVGGASDTDSTASFAWSGNGYNSTDSIEGPEIRVEGNGTGLPALSFNYVSGQTYLMLFEFDGGEGGSSSAWILNESQLTNFYGSLDAATLNGATEGTEDPTGVVWRGTVVDGFPVGSMTNLILYCYAPTPGGSSTGAPGEMIYLWDEIRISDTSLLESVVGEEPVLPTAGVRILGTSKTPGAFTITYDSGGAAVNVFRSSPGLDGFEQIATGENSGTFTDSSAPAGKAFYRLEIVE